MTTLVPGSKIMQYDNRSGKEKTAALSHSENVGSKEAFSHFRVLIGCFEF